MKRIKTENVSKYNLFRKIIRDAMNETKQLEWSGDKDIARYAAQQWSNLDKLFKKLGSFVQ